MHRAAHLARFRLCGAYLGPEARHDFFESRKDAVRRLLLKSLRYRSDRPHQQCSSSHLSAVVMHNSPLPELTPSRAHHAATPNCSGNGPTHPATGVLVPPASAQLCPWPARRPALGRFPPPPALMAQPPSTRPGRDVCALRRAADGETRRSRSLLRLTMERPDRLSAGHEAALQPGRHDIPEARQPPQTPRCCH